MPTPGVLNDSPAAITQAVLLFLQGQGILPSISDPTAWASGVGNAWPVFASGESDKPDAAIFLRDTVGQVDGASQLDGATWDHYGVQVMVRAPTHSAAWTMADQIRDAMARNVYDLTVTVTLGVSTNHQYVVDSYSNIKQVLTLGKEISSSKRSLCTVNAMLTCRQVS